MVRRVFAGLVVAAALCLFSGCSKPSPEQIKLTCNLAGQASALSWVAIEQPTQEQIEGVKVVLVTIKENVTEWPVGGFKSVIPTIDEIVAKKIPGTDEKSVALRKLCHLFATASMTSLDVLFDKHPDWKTKGAEVGSYVSAFCDGGLEGLTDFKEKSRQRALERAAGGK